MQTKEAGRVSKERGLRQGEYKVALNFFPLRDQDFKFVVYRRPHADIDREDYPNLKQRRLPSTTSARGTTGRRKAEYRRYWVSYEQQDGFEVFHCTSRTNNYLTLDYLYHLLKRNCSSLDEDEYYFEDWRFNPRALFVLQEHQEGKEVVWLEPYLLKAEGEFGYLADFRFAMPSHSRVSKRSLELSLAHKNGQPNKDFYADRFSKLQRFISLYHDRLFPLRPEKTKIAVRKTLCELEARSLRSKTYVLANDATSNSQFQGVKQNGPLRRVDDDVKVYFVYRSGDRPLSRDLYRALRGDTFRTFPGMEAMFGYKMDSSSVGGATTESFEVAELEDACNAIEVDAEGRRVVPVLITPFNREGDHEANRTYYRAKHTLLKRGWPSQFVSLDTLKDRNKLKWSVSGIGLQIFAKMGGQPWKVRPETDRCLIVGLGQSHREAEGKMEKYFAYSVLTDSSGLYEELRVLGSSVEESDYLQEFRYNFRRILEEYGDKYDRFVIHAPFKVQKRELDAVKQILDDVHMGVDEPERNTKFAVLKFNDRNRFFGYSEASNSLIPYESSFLQLSKSEYLVWFEGLQWHRPNVYKRIERPLHVELVYPEVELIEEDQRVKYLQDSVNLSGANWRGFNAKSLPISVYYAKIIADYSKEFQALGLGEIDLNTIHPWFL
jgi:hypothetical protein